MVERIQAKKGTTYLCADPSCGVELVPYQGQIREWHYQHAAVGVCTQESLEHWTAKYLIAQTVNDPVTRTKVRVDSIANCAHTEALPLPSSITRAIVEPKSLLQWGLKPDVLVEGAFALIAVELFHSNAVSQEKAERYKERGIRWVELRAAVVLNNPLHWRPLAVGRRRVGDCSACITKRRSEADESRTLAERVDAVAKRWQLGWSREFYRAKIWKCWSRECRTEMLVFSWHPHEPWPRNPPPALAPATIRWSKTKRVPNGYHANTCPACRKVQGDWDLYFHADGPFFGTEHGGDGG